MNGYRFLLPVLLATLLHFAVGAKEHPTCRDTGASQYSGAPARAQIKVGYNYHEVFVRGADGVVERDIPFVLLASPGLSKFYCRSTEFKDSLQSTPAGRALFHKMLNEGIRKYAATRDRDAMEGVTYRTQMYVFKYPPQNRCEVYDNVQYHGKGVYSEPLDEMQWEIIGDTREILGYECIKAQTNYHGRCWTAWFAPDVPLPDGPWKLHGLPGLILEASDPSGHHTFSANGIEACDAEITPIYSRADWEPADRKEMLRARRNGSVNGNAIVKAQIGLDLGANPVDIKELDKYDYLETDYR